MSRHISTGIEELDDIVPRAQHAIRETARQIGKEIEIAYEDAIYDFYASYHPKRYKRTHSLYHGSSAYKGKSPYFKSAGYSSGSLTISYVAGILIGPEFYPGNPYAKPGHYVSVPWVFSNSFEKGIHGFTRSMVIKHNDEIKELNREFKTSIQSWNIKANAAPPREPYGSIPYNVFQKKFRNISKDSYISKTFESYFMR